MRFSSIMMAAMLPAAVSAIPPAALEARWVLPADTFAVGPPSGLFDGDGHRRPEPLYPAQPVQGFSAVQLLPGSESASDVGPIELLALSDNGFGALSNSPDYLLRLYPITLGEEEVVVGDPIGLSDPDARFPHRIVHELIDRRLLTGSDLDVESFVIAPDGSLWIGDEFGPFLLRFSADGVLQEEPIEIPLDLVSGTMLRSPQHPRLREGGPQPGQLSAATLPTSGGFEGLAISPDGTRVFAMLEKAVEGDDPLDRRVYPFDLESRTFLDHFVYRVESEAHAIGELYMVNEREFLVIERDSREGDEARFKKIYLVEMLEGNRRLANKSEWVDLLNIANPEDLFGGGGVFRFPFITIEAVLPLGPRRLLVCNDNNFRRAGGRPPEPDHNEFIVLALPEAKALQPAGR